MMGRTASLMMVLALLVVCGPVAAEDVYQEPDAFLNDAFDGQVPDPKALWLSSDQRDAAARILQHSPHMLRVRYWQSGQRTAWILEEIGKERPITVGVVVEAGAIDEVAVLIYRESIGWEVRHRFFTQQFERAELNDRLRLTNLIDGISGATLSVRAVTGVVRLAAYFHGEVTDGS
jgi:hypothetical protein